MTARLPMPEADSQVHPIYARLLRMLQQQSAVDGDQVLAAAGLDWDSLMRDDRRLSRDTEVRLVATALAATGKPWLGLDLGGWLQVLARFAAVRNDALVWTLQSTDDGAALQAIDRSAWGPARAFVVDTVVAATLRVIEAALGQRPAGLRVDLPLAQPPWAAHACAPTAHRSRHCGTPRARPVRSGCCSTAA